LVETFYAGDAYFLPPGHEMVHAPGEVICLPTLSVCAEQ
jgi:hypothetical protein